MGNGQNNPHYQPGMTDIVGSLDTRNIGSRYGDIEAITPNTDLTPEGRAKSDSIFAPTIPPDKGMTPEERQAKFVGDSAKAETVASTVDGIAPEAKATADTFGAAEVISKIGPEGMEVTRTSADDAQLTGRGDDDGPSEDPAVTVAETMVDDRTTSTVPLEGDNAEPDVVADSSTTPAVTTTDALAHNWRASNKSQLTEAALARGVEVDPAETKQQIIDKLEAWQESHSSV